MSEKQVNFCYALGLLASLSAAVVYDVDEDDYIWWLRGAHVGMTFTFILYTLLGPTEFNSWTALVPMVALLFAEAVDVPTTAVLGYMAPSLWHFCAMIDDVAHYTNG